MFEPVVLEMPMFPNRVIVRPTHLSICNADQRYYQGRRSAKVLAKKLPMALVHEGIGTVVEDASGVYAPGTSVVMLPNSPREKDDFIAENYLRSSEFCGSGFDGFMQEYVALPPTRVVPLPAGVNKNVAAFTELVSVAVHAVTRYEAIAHGRREVVGIWGDGNLGFIVALVLRMLHPATCLVVFGRNMDKLADFTFVDEAYLTYDVSRAPLVDHAFECCGGDGSASAIDQIIDRIKPEGSVSLLGVSENPVPVNTRMVLEKGLRLFGSSRSGKDDFQRTVQMYYDHPVVLDYLTSLVGAILPVGSTRDMAQTFEVDIRKSMGKTIMLWDV